MNEGIVLLDLFSGIGGFSLGLHRAGIKIREHYFSEVDKHAIAIYKQQFKDAKYVGSVTTLDGGSITRPNIITFGSPCQDFSVAGRRAGLEGQRSSLIGEAIRLITECRPDVFIWENVKGVFSSSGGADFWAVIQAFTNIGGYRLEWQLLNTAWFLPQNRERVYLVGHLATDGGDIRGVFPFGEADFIACESGEKGGGGPQISAAPGREFGWMNVSGALRARDYKDPKLVKVGEDSICSPAEIIVGDYRNDEGFRPREDGNAPSLNARQRTDLYGPPHIVITEENASQKQDIKVGDYRQDEGFRWRKDGIAPSIVGSNPKSGTPSCSLISYVAQTLDTGSNQGVVVQLNPSLESGGQQPYQQNRVYDADGISPALHSLSEKMNIALSPNYGQQSLNDVLSNNELNDGDVKALDLYNKSVRDECPTLTEPHHNSLRIYDGREDKTPTRRIRRLTEIECERLQGFPETEKMIIFALWKENYTDHQKNHAQYVGDKCHKLLNVAGNVENEESKNIVLSVGQSLNINYLQIEKHVADIVHIYLGGETIKILNQEKSQSSVSIVEEKNLLAHLINTDNFALLIVYIITLLEKMLIIGREELHPKEQNLIHQQNGLLVLNSFGKEITQLVKDAKLDTTILEKHIKSIISSPLDLSNIGLTLQTLFYSALTVIDGYIPNKIKKNNLLIYIHFKEGWTEYGNYDGIIRKVSKTQRYKTLGNAVTVRVVEEIGKRLWVLLPR